MLLSILTNLISIYSLISLPLVASQTIDVSRFADEGKVKLIKIFYQQDAPYRVNNQSLGVEITAQSALIIDKKTGVILWQKNPEEVRSIASITKLMTALVFLDHNPGWQTEVIIQTSDYREGGRIRVYQGERLYVKDLFNASLVASANNATMSLVRSTGLSEEEFVKAMNQKALDLGMTQSNYIEPTGLDPQNVSTAFDINKLAQAAFSHSEIVQATIQSEYQFEVLNTSRTEILKNTDKLLESYLNVQAGKTGYLDEAGYCLASQIRGPEGQEVRIVVLGSESEASRFQETKALAQWVFGNFRWEVGLGN